MRSRLSLLLVPLRGQGLIFHQRRMDLIFSVNGRRGFLWIVWSLLVWSSRCNPKRASNTLNIFFLLLVQFFRVVLTHREREKKRSLLAELVLLFRRRLSKRERERINEETR